MCQCSGECFNVVVGVSVFRHLHCNMTSYCSTQEITATVETDDGGRFAVKLLDCDTITQAKEKIIDAVFKSVRASQRCALEEVDLEWRLPDSTTRLLRDEDQTSVVDGPWRRINTLKHYEVSHMTVT